MRACVCVCARARDFLSGFYLHIIVYGLTSNV